MLEALAARGGEEGRWECAWGRQGSRGLGSWQRPPPPPPLARWLHTWPSDAQLMELTTLPGYSAATISYVQWTTRSPYAVVAPSVLRVSCLWVLRPLLYWIGRSRFLFSCEVAFKVVFVFLTKQTGVDRCYVAVEQPEMDVIDPNLSIAVRSWSSFTSCLWENIRWFHVL